MPLLLTLPLVPPDAQIVSDSLAIHNDGEHIVFFNSGGPIFTFHVDDRVGIRLAAVTVIREKLAGVCAVARALGLHRATLFRNAERFKQGGVQGLVAKPRGPQRAHKLTPPVLRRAQKMLNDGKSIRATATSVGVTARGLRHAIGRGLLTAPSSKTAVAATPVTASQGTAAAPSAPSARAAEDQHCESGVAVKRVMDRGLAKVGLLVEAEPEFTHAEAVPGAGVLLALPALLEQGLLDVGSTVYGSLRNGFFGLRATLLTFAFMALLRIKNPEQLTGHAPGELGHLLGLDRMPEVKTLRRKLAEMGERALAHEFSGQLATRWAKSEPDELAVLYVDGHVRPYNGRTHTLPKLHVQQRGRPMPATKDFHVGDRRAEPLLFVTAPATEGLLSMLDSILLPQVRELVGPERRITIAFDREGWSPKLFAKWKNQKFDVLTYRKGEQSTWQKRFFHAVEGDVDGNAVTYSLAERRVTLSNGLRVREIRRRSENGHQTSIITTNDTLSLFAVAHRMFSRWKQENFFRYMRHEFALDHLCTYHVEAADPERMVTEPGRKALQKKLAIARRVRNTLIGRRLDLEPGQKARIGKKRLDEDEIDALIETREAEIKKLAAAVAELPKDVPLSEVLDTDKIVQLERERKILVDTIKLTAYRAESSLARLTKPFLARHEQEARKFLKSIFQATADVIPDQENHQLTVRFHGLASPRATRALAELCGIVSASGSCYPGTDLRLRFEAPMLQK